MTSNTKRREAILVIGLGYGDCGKGTIVDCLTRSRAAHTVVRFNGGPQAAHNVLTPDGRRHHTFAQFGAGSFVPGVRTLLSRFVLVEPYAMLREAAHLEGVGVADPLGRLLVDERCPVITPYHQAANRLRELARGAAAAHGTCGMGVGEVMSDLVDDPAAGLFARDLTDRTRVTRELRRVRERKVEQLRHVLPDLRMLPAARRSLDTLLGDTWVDAALDAYDAVAGRAAVVDPAAAGATVRGDGVGTVVFEGAQGVLLDEWRGFHPYTTWSTTTFENAHAVLDEAGFDGRRTRVGVLRAYATRHGPGPFPTESPDLRGRLPEPHNGDAGPQGRFRVGTFDAVSSRYALAAAGGVDALALTHLDRLPATPPAICTAYAPDRVDNELFSLTAGVASGIRLGPPRDLAYQERLTAALCGCTPIGRARRSDDPPDFIGMIEEELSCPVGLASFGPTAREKRLLKAPLALRAAVGPLAQPVRARSRRPAPLV